MIIELPHQHYGRNKCYYNFRNGSAIEIELGEMFYAAHGQAAFEPTIFIYRYRTARL